MPTTERLLQELALYGAELKNPAHRDCLAPVALNIANYLLSDDIFASYQACYLLKFHLISSKNDENAISSISKDTMDSEFTHVNEVVKVTLDCFLVILSRLSSGDYIEHVVLHILDFWTFVAKRMKKLLIRYQHDETPQHLVSPMISSIRSILKCGEQLWNVIHETQTRSKSPLASSSLIQYAFFRFQEKLYKLFAVLRQCDSSMTVAQLSMHHSVVEETLRHFYKDINDDFLSFNQCLTLMIYFVSENYLSVQQLQGVVEELFHRNIFLSLPEEPLQSAYFLGENSQIITAKKQWILLFNAFYVNASQYDAFVLRYISSEAECLRFSIYLVQLLSDDDCALLNVLLLILKIERQRMIPSADFSLFLFSALLKETQSDVDLFVDFMLSSETFVFLEYLLLYLKLMMVKRKNQSYLSVFLEQQAFFLKFHTKLKNFSRKNIFPYNIQPLLRKLELLLCDSSPQQ